MAKSKMTKNAEEIENKTEETVEQEVVEESQFEKKYFDEMKASGLDVFFRGYWQRKYAHFLSAVFDIRWKQILDLGCAAGSITSALAEFSDKIIGVDISKYCKENTKFDNFKFINTCVSDLSGIPDNTVEFVHSHDCFNFVPEDKRLKMFKEIQRVSKDGTILFSIQKLASVKKTDGLETLYPKYLWDELASKSGMKDGTKVYFDKIMKLHASINMMREYNWNYLVYKIVK